MNHAVETRSKGVLTSYCIDPACEFYNQPAVQGHCFAVLDKVTDAYITRVMQHEKDEIAWMKEQYGEKYVETLEGLYVCMMANWRFTLDELVSLRRDNARLKEGTTTEVDTLSQLIREAPICHAEFNHDSNCLACQWLKRAKAHAGTGSG